MKIEIFLWVLMSLGFVFCVPGCKSMDSSSEVKTRFEQKIGDQLYKGLKDPLHVTYFAVVPKRGSPSGYDIVSDEKKLPDDLAWLLEETLIDDQTYFFNKTKMCQFIPEMGFRFQGEREIIVLVSFTSRQVKFISGTRQIILDDDPKHEVFENNFQELLTHLK